MELLGQTYGLAGVLDLDFTPEMINHALMKEAEQAAWEIWIAVYPNFTEETFIPFSDFKDQQLQVKPPKQLKSFDDIVDEMTEVVSAFEARKRGD